MLGWSREARERVDPGGLLQQVSSEGCVGTERDRCEPADIYPGCALAGGRRRQ
jgi:hypothetical protein